MYLIYNKIGRIAGFIFNENGYDTCIKIDDELYEYLSQQNIMVLQLDINNIQNKDILTIVDVDLFTDLTLG